MNHNLSNCSDICESCVVEINPNINDRKHSFVVVGVYKPPSSPSHLFTEYLDDLLTQVSRQEIFCVGDFNIDLLDDASSAELCNVMYSRNIFPLINIATRITDTTAKCLDHIWCNRTNTFFSGAFEEDISDHYPIFAVLNITKDNKPVKKIIRDLSDQNVSVFISAMPSFVRDFYEKSMHNDINFLTEWFCDNLLKLYDKHCPKKIKTVSRKRCSKPWLTDELIGCINYKHLLFKKYKLGIVPFSVYRENNNHVSALLKKAKHNYYKRKLTESRNDIKRTWKTINTITNMTKSKSDHITLTDREGNDVHDPDKVANMFCDYFSSVAAELDRNIPVSNVSTDRYMPPAVRESFFVAPSTAGEIKDIVLSMPNKGFTLNTIPVFIYKKIIDYISPILSFLFNKSVAKGLFPDILKIARVTPIFKSKSHKIVSNFRPISVLSFTSKILEKLMKTRVLSHLEKHNIIYEKQFGFRRGLSTADAVLEFVDHCVTNLDSKLYTIAIFLDLSKAFDTVNRDIMLDKLENIGIRGIANKWFESYLSDRRMYVQHLNSTSTTKTMNIGLPQGRPLHGSFQYMSMICMQRQIS